MKLEKRKQNPWLISEANPGPKRWTRRMSWNTVSPGMSVFSKNTGSHRVISASRYALFHTVLVIAIPYYRNVVFTKAKSNVRYSCLIPCF